MGVAGGDDSDSSSSDRMSTEETTPVRSSDIHAIIEVIRKESKDRRKEAEGFEQRFQEMKKEFNKVHKELKKLNRIIPRTQSEQLNGSSGDGPPAPRSEPNHMHPPRFSLKIKSNMKDAVEKGNCIITDDGDSIVVDLYDGDNLIAPSHPLASARVLMVVLDGKFNNSRCSWSKEDFEKSIKRPREGNSAIGDVNQGIESIVSNCTFHLVGGTRRHSGAMIYENSGNSKVKLGVMVLSHPEVRVLEGVSEKSFHVRDVSKKLKKKKQDLVGCGQERNGPMPNPEYSSLPILNTQTTGNISGQPQLQADTNMPPSSSTPWDNTLGADRQCSVQPATNQQLSPFSEGHCPMISNSMNQTMHNLDGGEQPWMLNDVVQAKRKQTGYPERFFPVQLLWDRPGVEPSKRWNLLDQLMPLYSSQTKIHSGYFPTMCLMPEHYDSLTTYSQGRLFFNEQVLFLKKMMRGLQITSRPNEVMQTYRNRGVLTQPLEPDDSDDEPPLKRELRNKYQLRFVNKVCEAYYTGEKIKADDGNLLNVALYDENNAKITSGPLSSASLEVVVLHGDFNATGQDYWTSEEFGSCVVCPQSRKEPPAIGGDRVLVLVDGQASLGDAFFQKSSIYARTGKFKMGVMLAGTSDERVQEGISEPFWVWIRKGGRTGCTVFQRWHRAINAIIFILRLQSETYMTRSMRRPLLSMWHRAINAIIFISRLQSGTYMTRSMRRPMLSVWHRAINAIIFISRLQSGTYMTRSMRKTLLSRTGKFKMGVTLACTSDERVQEGISEPFWVWNRKGGRTGCTAFQRWHSAINAIIFISRLRSETYKTRKMRRPLLSRDTGDACLELLKEQHCMQDSLLDAWTSGVEGFGVQLPKAAVMKNVTLLDPRNKDTPHDKMIKKRDILDVKDEEYPPFADIKENDNKGAAEEAHDGNSGKEKGLENTHGASSISMQTLQFVPNIRSGSFAHTRPRSLMEEHIRIDDLCARFGSQLVCPLPSALYGVFVGRGSPGAAAFMNNNATKFLFEDCDFPKASQVDGTFIQSVEKSVRRAFSQADLAMRNVISRSSGTTAFIALVFGRQLLVANSGDCRAVLCRKGVAIEMSRDHSARRKGVAIEMSRDHSARRKGVAIEMSRDHSARSKGVISPGDWDIKYRSLRERGIKGSGGPAFPQISEPAFLQTALTVDDEFLILACDGVWGAMSNTFAVHFARQELCKHGDPERCARELVSAGLRFGATNNLTVIVICFVKELGSLQTPTPTSKRKAFL